MKKRFSIILSALLVVVLAMTVSAADSSVSLTPSSTQLELGDTFTVVAKLTNTDPIQLGTVALSYDESVFELTGGTCHVEGANPALVVVDQKAGTFFLGTAKAVAGDIFTFNFKVKDNAAYGTYKITPTAAIGTSAGTQITAKEISLTVVCDHSYPATWTKVDGEYHEKICSKCQTHDKQKHTWDEGELISPPSCTGDGEEKYTCLDGCGATKTEKVKALGHSWDNACDKTCNRKDCGYTRETSHEYSATWKSDATGHWHECIKKCGSKSDFAAHTPGAEATVNDAQTCTVCKYEIASKLEHVHSFGTEWNYDTESHWHRCETPASPDCYEKGGVAPHDYDDACDVSCNTCGYVRIAPHNYSGEWRGSREGHWSVCTLCNAESPVMPHNPGAEATEDTPQTCTECNYIVKMELSHVHEFSETWYSDEENHWQSCSDMRCPEVASLEAHVWDEGEELPEGGFLYTCGICAKQVTMQEPIGTEPSTVPSTGAPTNPDASRPAEKEPKDAISWEWAGIAAIVLLIVGVVLLVIEFIRSRKINMHGKFSK